MAVGGASDTDMDSESKSTAGEGGGRSGAFAGTTGSAEGGALTHIHIGHVFADASLPVASVRRGCSCRTAQWDERHARVRARMAEFGLPKKANENFRFSTPQWRARAESGTRKVPVTMDQKIFTVCSIESFYLLTFCVSKVFQIVVEFAQLSNGCAVLARCRLGRRLDAGWHSNSH